MTLTLFIHKKYNPFLMYNRSLSTAKMNSCANLHLAKLDNFSQKLCHKNDEFSICHKVTNFSFVKGFDILLD